MSRRPFPALLALAALALLAGCSKSGNPTAPKPVGFGTVTMSLTDAPADLDHVYLDVREVWVHRVDDGTAGDTLSRRDDMRHHDGGEDDSLGWHGGDGDSLGDGHDGDHERDDHGMWHRLDVQAGIVDLLDLRNGVFKTLASGRVPAGVYDQMRLVLGPNNSIVMDGVESPLKVPSGETSGYKLFGRFEVPIEGSVDVGIDFDAARSVHQTGTGLWILRPVARMYEITTTGRIHGRIDPAMAVSDVYATQGADTVAATQSAGDGGFTLALLPPGDYDVRIAPTIAGFRDTVLTGVHVEAGHTTELGVITLGGAGEAPGRLIGHVYPSTFVTRVALHQSGMVVDSTTTAPDGSFAFEQLTPGTYDARFEPMDPGYQPKTIPGVVVGPGATVDLGTVTLDPVPASGSVSGHVDPASVTTTVVLLDGANAPLDSVATESGTGYFVFAGLANGTYGLALKPPSSYQPRYFGPFSVTGAPLDVGTIYLSPAMTPSALMPRR